MAPAESTPTSAPARTSRSSTRSDGARSEAADSSWRSELPCWWRGSGARATRPERRRSPTPPRPRPRSASALGLGHEGGLAQAAVDREGPDRVLGHEELILLAEMAPDGA